jgi:hypothetical protein
MTPKGSAVTTCGIVLAADAAVQRCRSSLSGVAQRPAVGRRRGGSYMIRELWDFASAGFLVFVVALACSPASRTEEVLVTIPLDSLDEIITKSGVTLDPDVTTDGRGSIKINASEPATVRIAEIEGLSVENARLIYRARLRSAELRGQAYLEMWCVFPGRGEYFSRALQSPLVGTNDWVSQETPFFLQEGERPNRVKLNLVVNGQGTVWLDEVVLAKAPL